MAILFFRSARNNQPGRGCLDLAPSQVSLNSVRWLLRRSENVSASQRPRRPSCFPIGPKTRTWERMLRSFFLSNFDEFCSAVSEEKSKMPQPIRGQGGHRLFRISSKNTNLVEAVEILLPVNFRWIPLGAYRGEVENVSTNQRQSCFSDRPENTNLVEHVEILLPVKFRWIPFQGEVENVSANQRPRRPSCFSDRPEKHKLGRGRWDLASCKASINSI